MSTKPADLLSAVVVSLWAVLMLPMWRPALRLLDDDFLWFIGPMIGLVVLVILTTVTAGALAVSVGVLLGDDRSRLFAVIIGMVTFMGGLSMLATSGATALTQDTHTLLMFLLGFVGGPVLVVAGIASTASHWRRPRTFD